MKLQEAIHVAKRRIVASVFGKVASVFGKVASVFEKVASHFQKLRRG